MSSLRWALRGTAVVTVLGALVVAPSAPAVHTAGGALGGALLPDLRTKEPERLSTSQTTGLYLIDPSPAGFASVPGSRQTWSRAANLVTGDLVYDSTSLGTKLQRYGRDEPVGRSSARRPRLVRYVPRLRQRHHRGRRRPRPGEMRKELVEHPELLRAG